MKQKILSPKMFGSSLLAFIVLFFSTFSACKSNTESTNAILADQVKNSAEYKDYAGASQEIAELIAMKKYLPLTDSQNRYLKNNSYRMKTGEEIHKIYKEAGIVGSEEYLSAEEKAFNALFLIHKKFPEFNKISISDQNAILRQDNVSTRLSLESVFNSRKNNNGNKN